MTNEKNPPSLPQIDFEYYAKLLGDADPNDPDVKELIETLFNIQLQIADICWGFSFSKKSCGKALEKVLEAPSGEPSMVKLKDRFKPESTDQDKADSTAVSEV